MKKLFLLIFLLILIFSYKSFAFQIIENEDDILELLNCGEIDYSQYLNLLNLFNEKIDINRDNLFELQEIPEISLLDVMSILEYRNNYGKFNSIYDLKTILKNEETFERIKSFIVAPIIQPKQTKFESKVYGSRETNLHQKVESFENLSLYYGENTSVYVSFQKDDKPHRIKKIYLKLHKIDLFQNIVWGNFRAKFGEGLLVWENFKGGMLEICNNNHLNLTLIRNEDGEKGNLVGANLKLLLLPKKDKINIGGIYLHNSFREEKLYGVRINYNLDQFKFFTEIIKNKEKNNYIIGTKYTNSYFNTHQYFRYYDSNFPDDYTYKFKNNDNSSREYFGEFNYYLNKIWQIYGCYLQENDLVNILNNNKVSLKLFGKLSSKFRFSLSKELKEEDTEKAKEQIENTRLRMKFNFSPFLETDLYFRYTQETSQINHYLKLSNTCNLSKDIKIKGEAKFQNTNVNKQGQEITGFRVTFEQKLLPYFKYLLKYDRTNYSKDYYQNSKDKVKMQMEVKW